MLWLAVGLVLAAALLVQSASATIDTAGGTNSYTETTSVVWATPIIASASGSLQSIGVNYRGTPSSSIIVGIYSDSGGLPAARLAYSSITAATAGWNDLAVTGVNIVASTQYWIATSGSVQGDSVYRDYPTASASRAKAWAYNGLLPNPWGSDYGTNPVTNNVRMTYGAGTTTTTTLSSTTTTTTTLPTTTTTTTLPPTGIWIPPGRLATVKFLTPLSPGTHTIRLCTASACQAGYLTIV